MVEVAGQPSPGPTGTTTEAPESLVLADGSFVENWHTKLADANLQKDETLPRFKKLEDLAKSYVNVRKQVPMNKVAIPTETSPPEMWEDYFRAIGRPVTADEYHIEKPEGIPDNYWNDDLVKQAKELFHKIGLTPKQTAALMELDNQRILAGIKIQTDAEANAKTEAENALRKKWGVDYDTNIHLGNRMIAENVAPESKEKFLTKYGNDPDFAEFAAKIAGKFMEHKIITDAVPPSVSIGDVDAKIAELRRNPAHNNRNHPDHKMVMEQITNLFKEKSKVKKPVNP